jgi:hypothetical protein
VHETGALYTFLVSPREHEIAAMPPDAYRELAARAGDDEGELREQLLADPVCVATNATAKVREGRRRRIIFRFASSARAFGVPYAAALGAASELNRARCEPPLPEAWVETHVRGAYDRYPAGTWPRRRCHGR